MADGTDIPAWILLFVGLYAFTASIGELRSPGYWAAMLTDFERQPALRFLTGLFTLSLGGAIYMVNPWQPGDWVSILVTLLGGFIAFEGAVILAMGDRFLMFARALMGRTNRAWAIFSAVFGLAAIAVAFVRI